MKEFLNKLKTPTKILSIVCFVLVIMLFSKCNEANEEKGKNQQLTEQIITKDSIIKSRDSIIYENETTIRFLNDSIKDMWLLLVTNRGDSQQSKHGIEISLIKAENKIKELTNENAWLRKEKIEFKNKNLQ